MRTFRAALLGITKTNKQLCKQSKKSLAGEWINYGIFTK